MVQAITHVFLYQIIGCVGKKVLKYGENNYRNGTPSGENNTVNTEHSEIAALKQLKYATRRGKDRKNNNRRRKKFTNIDIIVIRINKTGTRLGVSNMCERCVIGAATIPQQYGFRIKNVVYSNADGTFTKAKLADLIHSDNQHISKFYRENGYTSCLC
jgi:hypothetical protein